MVILKSNNNKQELVASYDIELGTLIFSSSWHIGKSSNPFLIPKTKINTENQNIYKVDDLFDSVVLDGFGYYIKPTDKKPNTKAVVRYESQSVDFYAITRIHKDNKLTYCLDFNNLPNVTIQ